MNDIVEIGDHNFEREVLTSEKPVLLDFGAVWCGPCRALWPVIQSIASEFADQVRVGKVDIDEAPGVSSRLRIRGAPTVVVFKGGREVGRHVGVTRRETLVKLLDL